MAGTRYKSERERKEGQERKIRELREKFPMAFRKTSLERREEIVARAVGELLSTGEAKRPHPPKLQNTRMDTGA